MWFWGLQDTSCVSLGMGILISNGNLAMGMLEVTKHGAGAMLVV